MELEQLKDIVIKALEDIKAKDIQLLDVRPQASFTDLMVIASGNSTRQVKAAADKVVTACRDAGVRPLGVEGERDGEWVLIDLGDIVVHVMLPDVRAFYNLEKLWSIGGAAQRSPVTG